MDPDWHDTPLPYGLTKGEVLDWAQKYAPKLFFHFQERHYPSAPERFRDVSRFRESRHAARDRGWSTTKPGWETSNHRGPEHYRVPWSVLEGETASRTGEQVRLDPATRGTLRPHGGRNLHRSSGLNRNGLFLERDGVHDRSYSGIQPIGNVVMAPVFLDATNVESSEAEFVKVLLWFFYELNQWHGLLTHEGD